MAISDAQYAAWLESDNVQRAVLVDANAHTGSSVDPFYLSNVAFVSKPTDTPANIPYDDIVSAIPDFTTDIDGNQSVGDIEIVNNGDLDDWLTYGWSGQPLQLYFGDPSWDRDDFRLILDGVCGGIRASGRSRLELILQDKRGLFDVPVQTSLLSDNQVTPIVLGRVFNCEPVLTNAGGLVYKMHDATNFGALTAVTAVRDNGIALATPAQYTVNLATGDLTLVNNPAGRVTFDALGPDTTTSAIVNTLASIATSDIDATNLSNYPDTSEVGIYIRDQITITAALNRVLRSSGGTFRFDRGGLLQILRLDLPTGTSTGTITVDDISQFGISVAGYEMPQARVRLGYQKNWSVQSADELAAAVTAANKKLYSEPYTVVSSDNAISTQFPNAETPPVIETLFSSGTAAQNEADRLAAIRADKRFIYRIEGFAAPLSFNVGDIVTLEHPRFGFSAGLKTVIVGLRESPTTGRVEMELWR